MLIPYGTDKEYKAKFDIIVHAYRADGGSSDYTFEGLEVTLPKVTMLPGYSYTYVVKLTGDSNIPGTDEFLKQIKFEVVGTDWTSDDATHTLNTTTTTVKTDTDTTNQGNSGTDTSNSGNN
jgi:hypothetical protein